MSVAFTCPRVDLVDVIAEIRQVEFSPNPGKREGIEAKPCGPDVCDFAGSGVDSCETSSVGAA